MAALDTVPVKTEVRDLVMIAGSFAPNGGSAVDATTRRGLGFSVARTSAGLFTVTLNAKMKFASLVSGNCTLQQTTATDLKAQLGDVDLSARTIKIRLLAVATETDLAANANNRIHFLFLLRNSKNFPTRG